MEHVAEGSDARGSRDPVPPLRPSIAHRSAPDLVFWSEPAQEERKHRGKSVPIGPNPAETTNSRKIQKLVQSLRANQSRGRSSWQTTTQRARVPNHADYCFMQDSLGSSQS